MQSQIQYYKRKILNLEWSKGGKMNNETLMGKGYLLPFFLRRMILLPNILVIYNQSKSHGQYTLHDNSAVHRIFGWEIYPGILIGNFWKEFTIYKPGNQETVPTEYLQIRETIIHLRRQWYFCTHLIVFYLELHWIVSLSPATALLVQSNYVSTPIKSCDIFNQLWQMLYSQSSTQTWQRIFSPYKFI